MGIRSFYRVGSSKIYVEEIEVNFKWYFRFVLQSSKSLN